MKKNVQARSQTLNVWLKLPNDLAIDLPEGYPADIFNSNNLLSKRFILSFKIAKQKKNTGKGIPV